jgi:hypothetical protein
MATDRGVLHGFSFRLVVLLAVLLPAFAASGGTAHAYSFGTGVRQTAPEERVFDWTFDRCESIDIPDAPARAFRDATGLTQLLATHYVSRRKVGFDLNGPRHSCVVLLSSQGNPDPAAYDDRLWITAPYTLDGQTIYSLLHNEYQGWNHNQCDPNAGANIWKCFFVSLGFAKSTDGGRTYVQTPAPRGVVAGSSYPYAANLGPQGLVQPSNIVYRPDGYFYVLSGVYPYGAQQAGSCLLRTHTLNDPTSWRAWDGSGFSVRFIDPYAEPSEPPATHVCTPVSPNEISTMSESLTYNTYFGKYLLLGMSNGPDPATGAQVNGVFYSLSDDLIHWQPRQLLMQSESGSTFKCGQPDPIKDPSLLYPASPSRNYETTGQDNYLYFTRWNVVYNTGGCYEALDRDLIRVPITFSAARGPVSKPDCRKVKASPSTIGTVNGRWVNVRVGDQAGSHIEITGVTQDEPTTGVPDALRGTTPDRVRVRADRRTGFDGRVYRVTFTATGGNFTCWGTATVSVPGTAAVDSAPPSYDSLNPAP